MKEISIIRFCLYLWEAVQSLFMGKKKTKMKKICLSSGSIVLMDGNSRLDYHGIRKIIKDEKNILNQKKNFGFPRNSRINITLRVYESKNY